MGVRPITAISSFIGLALALACGGLEAPAPLPEQSAPEAPPARPQTKKSTSAPSTLEGWIEGWDETDVIWIANSEGAVGVWCKDMDVCREPLSAHGHDPTFVFTVGVRPLTSAERKVLHEGQGKPSFVALSMTASPGAGGGDN